MQISLPADLAEIVEEKVESGLYQAPMEVLREALRMLAERDRVVDGRLAQLRADRDLEALRGQVEEGLHQARSDQLIPGEEAFAELEAKSRGRRSESSAER